MNITVQEAIDLDKALSKVANLSGKKFAYAVSRNSKKIETLLGQIEIDYAYKKAYQEYDKDRVKLCVEHAEKDNMNCPVIIDGENGKEYKMIDKEAFNEALESLKKAHAKAIKERDDQEEVYNKRLKEQIDFPLYTVPNDLVPDNITAGQLKGIWPILMDEAPQEPSKAQEAGLHAVQNE